ncbi:monovalent cation/H(+) antiporter subunit G [Microcella sp.]|uniref:monovalent cation/H(+) antiporter subunit G n=1 Tax=Microcella sp. TaxID=1913979 RepID=UPI00345CD558
MMLTLFLQSTSFVDSEPVSSALDLVAAVLLIVSALLTFAAAVGLLRFPDALARLHAATKPQILGLILLVVALALSVRSWAVLLLLIPVVVFQLLTAPIAAHMVGRAGYRTGEFDPDTLIADELEPDVDEAGRIDLPGGSFDDEPGTAKGTRAGP